MTFLFSIDMDFNHEYIDILEIDKWSSWSDIVVKY